KGGRAGYQLSSLRLGTHGNRNSFRDKWRSKSASFTAPPIPSSPDGCRRLLLAREFALLKRAHVLKGREPLAGGEAKRNHRNLVSKTNGAPTGARATYDPVSPAPLGRQPLC